MKTINTYKVIADLPSCLPIKIGDLLYTNKDDKDHYGEHRMIVYTSCSAAIARDHLCRWVVRKDKLQKVEHCPTINNGPDLNPAQQRLPTDSQERKNIPLAGGLLDYFPDALCAVAELSKKGNDKHNPGEPLHWARDKSKDHADCILRHLIDRGTIDPEDGILHDAKVAWRALAMLQLAIEKQRGQ